MKLEPKDKEKFESLYPCQKRVAALVALGMDDGEIAGELGVCYWTVRSYKSRLSDIVGIRTSLKLAVFIIRRPELEKMLRDSLNN